MTQTCLDSSVRDATWFTLCNWYGGFQYDNWCEILYLDIPENMNHEDPHCTAEISVFLFYHPITDQRGVTTHVRWDTKPSYQNSPSLVRLFQQRLFFL